MVSDHGDSPKNTKLLGNGHTSSSSSSSLTSKEFISVGFCNQVTTSYANIVNTDISQKIQKSSFTNVCEPY